MPKWKKVFFRRSPYLVCYWHRGKFVFENYATRARVTASPLTCEVLNCFDRWQPAEALSRHLPQFSPASLRKAIHQLVRHSLLERAERKPNTKAPAFETWKHWNPAAGFFHFSTKDVSYTTDPVVEERFLRRQARAWPRPSPVKRYPGARQVSLPAPRADGEFPKVLLARRTWRQFSRKPIELSALGILLWLTWGVQRWLKLPGLGRTAFKTAPSGGARHPIEVYVLALRVAGLPRGLYHYDAETHRLELLQPGASSRQVVRYLAGQWWFGPAAALLLMTAVFPRAQWKYPSPRAYRAVLLEAGHLCQTFCLTATWLGLAPFCTMALADSEVEKALGVDGVTESVLYAAGVGARPPGVDWAPWPVR